MIDVFISYSHKDTGPAREVVEELRSRGHLVWWDGDLRGGQLFGAVIERMIDASRVTLVLWSQHSRFSEYVYAEASRALSASNYFALNLEAGVLPPVPFNIRHTLTLDGPASGSRRLDSTLGAVEREIRNRRGPADRVPEKDTRAWLDALASGKSDAIDRYLTQTDGLGHFAECAHLMRTKAVGAAPAPRQALLVAGAAGAAYIAGFVGAARSANQGGGTGGDVGSTDIEVAEGISAGNDDHDADDDHGDAGADSHNDDGIETGEDADGGGHDW